MKKFLMFVSAVFLMVAINHAFGDDTVNLEKKNTVSLREEYTASSVDAVKAKLIALSHTLSAKEDIYLFLDTPGGSVSAGDDLDTVIKGLKNKVNVIAHFAASMGYLTTQSTTGKRYVTQDGILMAHRAYLGVEGQTPGEIGTRLAFFEKITDDLAAMAAKRTGITAEAYQQKVVKEYWVKGAAAVKDNQADAVVNVSCSADLDGTSVETIFTMFGPIQVEWADCPLISQPVSINFARSELSELNPIEYMNFIQTFTDMLTKPKLSIVDDEALQTKYAGYVR